MGGDWLGLVGIRGDSWGFVGIGEDVCGGYGDGCVGGLVGVRVGFGVLFLL